MKPGGSGQRGWRQAFADIIPTWMRNRPGVNPGDPPRNVWYRLFWVLFAYLDASQQAAQEGIWAKYPGVGTATADGLTGQSRGLIKGEAESDASFEARLVQWLNPGFWPDAGSDEAVCRRIQEYLGNTPAVTIVDRSGNWTMLSSAGVFTYASGISLNWDSKSNPERAGNWSEIWIIVYPCEWQTLPNLAQFYFVWGGKAFPVPGTPPGPWGTGHLVNRAAVDAILQLVRDWKGAHIYVRAIIWSYDGTLFQPSNPASLPDGTWGNWGVGVGKTYVRSRPYSIRVWEPSKG